MMTHRLQQLWWQIHKLGWWSAEIALGRMRVYHRIGSMERYLLHGMEAVYLWIQWDQYILLIASLSPKAIGIAILRQRFTTKGSAPKISRVQCLLCHFYDRDAIVNQSQCVDEGNMIWSLITPRLWPWAPSASSKLCRPNSVNWILFHTSKSPDGRLGRLSATDSKTADTVGRRMSSITDI